jgi:ketosteroid isomerase-like protein
MRRDLHTSPQQAEQAFYDAFQKADLDAMMAVWAEDEEVCCVHPAGPRLSTLDDIRDSWRSIFSAGATMRCALLESIQQRGALLAVHSVYERITVVGERQPRGAVIATNVYLNTAGGWRMIVHHASPVASGERVPERESPRTPPILH